MVPLVYPPQELSHHEEPSTKVKQLPRAHAVVGRRMAKLMQQRSLLLPIEIMAMIFDYYVHLYRQLPEKLLLVCRTWHVLALSQPTLWTNLDPVGQYNHTAPRPWAGTYLQSRIARSNPAPLKVNFVGLNMNMSPSIVKKVAAIPTFLSRLQELTINHNLDINYLAGNQPLLKSLTIYNFHSSNKLAECLTGKELTTLCLRLSWMDKPPPLPDSLFQGLQTLEVTIPTNPEGLHEYWTMIQKSTTLRTLHISLTHGNSPVFFHPSIQHLSIVYPDDQSSEYLLEGVRMPRLREVVISAVHPNELRKLKLVETPVKSLHLKCRRPNDAVVDISWVDSAVHLLRSIPGLEKLEITMPSNLVSGLLEAFEQEASLCTELNAFLVNNPMGMAYVGSDGKRDIEAMCAQLRGRAATFIGMRQSGTLTTSR